MPSIGQNNFLVKLLHEKTKVSKRDIVDILKFIPECMAEAFIEANLPAKEKLYLGGVSLSWCTKQFGPAVGAKTSDNFRKHLTRLKLEGKYPLAQHFFEKMRPLNKEIAKKRVNKEKNILLGNY